MGLSLLNVRQGGMLAGCFTVRQQLSFLRRESQIGIVSIVGRRLNCGRIQVPTGCCGLASLLTGRSIYYVGQTRD